MARASAFQADDAGSIPVNRSMTIKDPFADYDDPDYWDEGVGESDSRDRRDYLGVLISYKDLKNLAPTLPLAVLDGLVNSLERWDDEVSDKIAEVL